MNILIGGLIGFIAGGYVVFVLTARLWGQAIGRGPVIYEDDNIKVQRAMSIDGTMFRLALITDKKR